MKLSKKTKTILTSSVSVLATTSVVAPLATMTSCSNNTSELESKFDKEYGVTEDTYNDMKDQFIKQYEVRLKNAGYEEGEEGFIVRSDYLKKQLSSLDNMKNQRKNGFTSLTSAMMEFAKSKDSHDWDKKPYDIKLTRKTKATWSQMDALFNSWKGSFRQYMLNSDMPAATITRVMQDAQNKFVSLKKELQQTCNDALDGIIQAKSRIISCFEEVNADIAFISSTIQLKEFLSQYVFEPKASADEQESCLDSLLKNVDDFKVGNVLSDTTMNKVFKITRKDNGTSVTFTNTLVKGYTIYPKLTNITFNNLSNIYTFSMDFGLVKTSYIDKFSKDQLANVTAHTYIADDFVSSDINDKSSLSDMIKKCAIKSIEYPIYLTKKAEQDALKDAYFNKSSKNGHISFNWDNNNADNQAYEAFFDNAKKTDGTWKSELSFNSLSNSCIRISNSDSNSSYKMVKDLTADISSRTGSDARVNNLAEQFLKDCEISANTTIDENNLARKTVTFDDFYANYKNSIYKKEPDGKLNLNSIDDYKAYQNQCINHKTSKAFFQKVNDKYNAAFNYVTLYDAEALKSVSKQNDEEKEEYLEKLLQSGEEQKFAATTALVAGSIATTAAIVEAWSPLTGANSKKIVIFSLLFLFVCLGLQAAIYALFMEFYYKPLVEFVEKEREIRKELEATGVPKELMDDSIYYEVIEEDGTFDQASFNEKMKIFDNNNMEWKLAQYRKYATLNSDKWNKFNKTLTDKDVDNESYKSKFDDWKVGGKYWLISLGFTLFTLIASICFGMWVKYQRKKMAISEDQQVLDKKLAENQNNTFKQQDEGLQSKIEESFKKSAKELSRGVDRSSLEYDVVLVWKKVMMSLQDEIWDDLDKKPSQDDWERRTKDLQESFNKRKGMQNGYNWDISTFAEIANIKL